MKKLFLLSALALGASLFWQLAVPQKAHAAYGRSNDYGYFTNNHNDGYGDFVLPGGTVTNPSIPYSVDSVNELESFVKNKLDSGNAWNHIGAAFIVQTMRGNDACGGDWCRGDGIDSGSGAFSDWEARIKGFVDTGGQVIFQAPGHSYNDGDCVNTMDIHDHVGGADGDPEDVAAYHDCTNERAIIFKKAGTVVYVIKYRCANPVGNLPGLPAPPPLLQGFKVTTGGGETNVDSGQNAGSKYPFSDDRVAVYKNGSYVHGSTANPYFFKDNIQLDSGTYTIKVNDAGTGDGAWKFVGYTLCEAGAKNCDPPSKYTPAGKDGFTITIKDEKTYDMRIVFDNGNSPTGTLTLTCAANNLSVSAAATFGDQDASGTYILKAWVTYGGISSLPATTSSTSGSRTWTGIPVPVGGSVSVTLHVPDVGPAAAAANNFTLTKTQSCGKTGADCPGDPTIDANSQVKTDMPYAGSSNPAHADSSSQTAGTAAPGPYEQDVPQYVKENGAPDGSISDSDPGTDGKGVKASYVSETDGSAGTTDSASGTITLDYAPYVATYPYDYNQATITYDSYWKKVIWTPSFDSTSDCAAGETATRTTCTSTYDPGTHDVCYFGHYDKNNNWVCDNKGTAPNNCNPDDGGTGPVCTHTYNRTDYYKWTAGNPTLEHKKSGPINASHQMSPCFDRSFTVQPRTDTDVTNVNLMPDTENPSSVSVGTQTKVVFTLEEGPVTALRVGMGVKGLDYDADYYIEHADGSEETLSGLPPHYDMPEIGGGVMDSGGSAIGPYNPSTSVSLPPLEVGDEICAEFTISPRTGTMNTDGVIQSSDGSVDSTRIPSPPTCSAPVSNIPYARFYGNDILAGIKFGGGTCDTSAKIAGYRRGAAGDGSQFAAMSLSQIQNFASAFLRGAAPVPPTGLSFANTTGGDGGGFNTGDCVATLPDYYTADKPSYSTPAALGSIDASTLPAGGHAYTTTAGTLDGQTIPDGVNVAIFVDGNVYIDDNITFNTSGWGWDTVNRTSNVPSFFLIAKGDINIAPGVTRLDGVYIAQGASGNGGTIRTCAAGGGSFGNSELYNACNNQLTINGSFIAQEVRLDRTFSSLRHSVDRESPFGGSHSCNPDSSDFRADCSAEIFNFSPEIYLSSPALVPSSGPRQYDSITSLSPIL